MFDKQPTLTDGTFLLRPLTLADLPALRQAASDPLIWAGHPCTDRYKPDVFDTLFTQLMGYRGALAVERAGQVIGSSTYYTGSTQPGTMAIGYSFLTRAYWGGAANLAVKSLLLDHAFQTYDTVWFHIGPDNVRSQKAVEKIGGVYSHTETMNTSNGIDSMAFYQITRSARRDRIG